MNANEGGSPSPKSLPAGARLCYRLLYSTVCVSIRHRKNSRFRQGRFSRVPRDAIRVDAGPLRGGRAPELGRQTAVGGER
jgi:hypothetical protein